LRGGTIKLPREQLLNDDPHSNQTSFKKQVLMTNISPAKNKGLIQSILSNIETYKKVKGSEDVLLAFKANLDALTKIYNEYNDKIKQLRELVMLYDQVQNCVRLNFRNARNWNNGYQHAPLVKTNILFSINKNVSNTLEISETEIASKKSKLVKLKPAENDNPKITVNQ
jgi:hypothetical protein